MLSALFARYFTTTVCFTKFLILNRATIAVLKKSDHNFRAFPSDLYPIELYRYVALSSKPEVGVTYSLGDWSAKAQEVAYDEVTKAFSVQCPDEQIEAESKDDLYEALAIAVEMGWTIPMEPLPLPELMFKPNKLSREFAPLRWRSVVGTLEGELCGRIFPAFHLYLNPHLIILRREARDLWAKMDEQQKQGLLEENEKIYTKFLTAYNN